MSNIESHLTSITDELTNLMSDDIQQYTGDYKKINIFNNNIKLPLQKIWLLTPKLKMLGNIYVLGKQKQVGSISLILYETDSEIRKFREFINNLEERMGEVVEENLGYSLTLKSLIKTSDTFFPSLTLQLPLNKKNMFDINNEIIKHDSVDAGSFVIAYIELSDIWLSNSVYGINLTILQMKAYPEFDFTKCIFKDGPNLFTSKYNNDDDNKPMLMSQLPIKKRGGPVPLLGKPQTNNEIIKKPEKKQQDSFNFTPTVGDLLSIKGRLKSIAKLIDSEEDKNDHLNEEIINIDVNDDKQIIDTIIENSIKNQENPQANNQENNQEINFDDNINVEQELKPIVKIKKKIKKSVKKTSVKTSNDNIEQ